MNTLDQIGVEHGTDKSSLNHRYLSLYDLMFRELQYLPIWILEVGVQFGNSLRTWKHYFPNATVTGIDSIDNNVSIPGVTIHIGDAYCQGMLDRFEQVYDIIIDDASHTPEDQVWFVENYPKLLANGGILIVEDVLTPSTIQRLKAALPKDFTYTSVDMTEGNSVVDSRLFIAWRI